MITIFTHAILPYVATLRVLVAKELFCSLRNNKDHKYTQVISSSGEEAKGNITHLCSLIRMTCPDYEEAG